MNDALWHPRVLVIGPSSPYPFQLLGFLTSIEDNNLHKSIDTFCGVSYGSIISLLLTIGYTSREIISEFATSTLFDSLLNFSIPISTHNNIHQSTEPFRRRLSTLVLNKLGIIPSLYNLYLQTGKSLITVSHNNTSLSPTYFTPFSYPHLSCLDAVLYSMNIPFSSYKLYYQSHHYIDGSISNIYPISFFDDTQTNILGIYTKNSNIDTDSPLLHIINSLMLQSYTHITNTSSSNCKHVCITIDSSISPFTIPNMAHDLLLGIRKFTEFFSDSVTPTISPPLSPPLSPPSYTYPNYYFNENNP